MSYSVCLKCKEMVGMYQKYCTECETTHKQDELFWKNPLSHLMWSDSDARNLDLKKDSVKTEPT